jgi:cell division septum initiation protein DivIVA
MNKRIILAVLLIAATAAGANAQAIRGKARDEHYRIAEGVRDGSLTRGETGRLAREQRDIHQDIRRARANDGHIGPVERANIRREERQASRDIYRAKHNGRYRA